MALIKAKATRFGAEAKYWKIESYQNNQSSKVARIVLCGYVDKKSRDEGFEPLEKLFFNVGVKDYDKVFGVASLDKEDMNPLKAAYQFIKELDEFFAEAEDA